MTKIEQIELAIEKAIKRESKITPLALSVPALSSLNIRHLMNNLGALCTKYIEVGVHRGGLFCSTICKNENIKFAMAVDSWASDETNEEKAMPDFESNVILLRPPSLSTIICKSDAFPSVTEEIKSQYHYPADLYLYDADHSEQSQCLALTYYLPLLADEVIFCVDDWDFPEVEAGTIRGLEETGVEILFSQIFKGNDHDNDGWWNGFAVFLLKKKP